MAANYLELIDKKLSIQLTNFGSALGTYATAFAFTPAEIAGILADAAQFAWTITNLKKMETNKRNWTTNKNILKRVEANVTVNTAPALPMLDVATATVTARVLFRFITMENRAKAYQAGILIKKDVGAGFVTLDKDFSLDFVNNSAMPAHGESALWR